MKNVFIPAGDTGIGNELLEQLRVSGITVRDVEGVDDIARLASSIGAGLFLVDAGRIARDPSLVTEIVRLKEAFGPMLRVFFHAEKDDFGIRLETVRAGGEAFFQLPADANRLAYNVVSLFNGTEDEPYLKPGQLGDSDDHVARIAGVAEMFGRGVATIAEARETLKRHYGIDDRDIAESYEDIHEKDPAEVIMLTDEVDDETDEPITTTAAAMMAGKTAPFVLGSTYI